MKRTKSTDLGESNLDESGLGKSRLDSSANFIVADSEQVEAMLGQLPLQVPAAGLDFRIDEILDCANLVSHVNFDQEFFEPSDRVGFAEGVADQRFGWSYLIATAMAASLFGFLIGRTNLDSPVDSAVASQHVNSQIADNASSNIKPVKFNVAAFEMLHGHSTQGEFKDCQACHVAEKKDGSAKDLFYGDSFFILQHSAFEKDAKCSKCHVGTGKLEMEDIFYHDSKFNGVGKCSKCHVNS